MKWMLDPYWGAPPWARVLNMKLDSIIEMLGNLPGQDPAKTQAIVDEINAQTKKLDDAVNANTPKQ